MARACKQCGALVIAMGMLIAIAFVAAMARDAEYRRAALVAARNPGNVLYEAEFKGAQARRAFQLIGVVGGVLLGFNGVTLLLLGVVAGRATDGSARS